MPRIYIANTAVRGSHISITGEKARYLISVLKCEEGDELSIFDGRGNCLSANIRRADKKEVLVEVSETFACNSESPVNIILLQGLLKGQKMDMIVQKVTELGVKEVQPVISVRSQLRGTRKVVRWRKIAEEASEQSGRSIVPIIYEPVELNQFLAGLDQVEQQGDLETPIHGNMKGFVFWEEGGVSLKEAVRKICISTIPHVTVSPIHILIGPEGGFTKDEVTAAEKKGFIVTTLGNRILRAETAAISSTTLVQFLLGDLG